MMCKHSSPNLTPAASLKFLSKNCFFIFCYSLGECERISSGCLINVFPNRSVALKNSLFSQSLTVDDDVDSNRLIMFLALGSLPIKSHSEKTSCSFSFSWMVDTFIIADPAAVVNRLERAPSRREEALAAGNQKQKVTRKKKGRVKLTIGSEGVVLRAKKKWGCPQVIWAYR